MTVVDIYSEGWVKPRGTAHRHFFAKGKARSLCGCWFELKGRGGEDAMVAEPADCVECNARLRDAMKAEVAVPVVKTVKTARDIWGSGHG